MCGIAGTISFSQNEILPQDRWVKFTDPLKYRGPDDRGDWHFNSDTVKVSLFHTRLSIIDLSPMGHQPMTADDGAIAISFNGEIYNFRDLRNELQARGIKFRSNSDTEVLLEGYLSWGLQNLLTKIDGMFAIALFDKKRNTLFLARDRFGKKPLYYSIIDKHLIFSSDIRSFSVINSNHLTIDLHALGYFFAEYGTPRENTIWKEVKKVKPASFIQFDQSGITDYQTYWHLNYTESCTLDRSDIDATTEHLLSNAVKKRLVSDVRVSALLSGGIDSSLVVAKMAEHSQGKVKTYSVGFHEKKFNELFFAQQVANRFNTDHTELIIKPDSLEIMDKLIWEYGEPFADSSMIPTYLMSKEIAKSEKVVMGGDGGDELFGGYDSYYFAYKYDLVKSYSRLYPVSKFLHKIYPNYRTDFLERLLRQTKSPHYTLLNRNFCFQPNELQKLLNQETFINSLNKEHHLIWNECTSDSSSDLIKVLSGSLSTRLLNDYLVKVDRASMYASLEMRSPFLDKDLAEFGATLRPDQIFHKSEPKSILKRLAKKHFSESFVYRQKMGFGIPIGTWFRGELANKLKEVVLDGKQKMIDINYGFVEKLLNEHGEGKADHTDKLWSLYVFHIWAHHQQ